MDYAAARKVMVDSQVRVNDVTDRTLQAALMAVPRERFMTWAQAREMARSGLVEFASHSHNLHRGLPLAHPVFPWLYASEVSEFKGVGKSGVVASAAGLEAPTIVNNWWRSEEHTSELQSH